MKRSEINQIILAADNFLHSHQFYLPAFAYWSVDEWRQKGPEVNEIVENGLGWDITDFGSGNFQKVGLFLFTIRNGHFANWGKMTGKLYAEKIMIAEEGQVTPMHFHWKKSEDIINRGGAELVIELHASSPDETLSDKPFDVVMDGVVHELSAGDRVRLQPGESITLPPYLYHSFWAEKGKVLIGEVSMVNDDRVDNRFLKPVGRFPEIVEDELPVHLLVGDYADHYGK